eukprot:SAG31_NODE_1704_length_7492_cov_49.815231_2_plen_172_part_00
MICRQPRTVLLSAGQRFWTLSRNKRKTLPTLCQSSSLRARQAQTPSSLMKDCGPSKREMVPLHKMWQRSKNCALQRKIESTSTFHICVDVRYFTVEDETGCASCPRMMPVAFTPRRDGPATQPYVHPIESFDKLLQISQRGTTLESALLMIMYMVCHDQQCIREQSHSAAL